MKRLLVMLLLFGATLCLFLGSTKNVNSVTASEYRIPCIEQLVKLSFLRFTDNGDGTVTDNWTGLVWMKNASNVDAVGFYRETWGNACAACNELKDGEHGLTDGSAKGDWRLPSVRELHSIVDYGVFDPALPEGHPFVGVLPYSYWSSSTYAGDPTRAWVVRFSDGYVHEGSKISGLGWLWCVRAGK